MRLQTPSEQRLERLRRSRNKQPAASAIGEEIERLTAGIRRQRGALGGLDDAWAELGPRTGGEVVGEVRSFSPGGVLTVRVPDAAARYEVEVWLRQGGLDALRARTSRTLRRVRLDVRPR